MEGTALIDIIENCTLMEWPNFISVLLGGVISAATTIGVLGYNQRKERENRQEERDHISALHAFSGHHKLLAAVNLLHNVKKSIDQGYAITEEAGIRSDEPWMRVPAPIGSFYVPDFLAPNELMFLQTKGHDSIVALAASVVERARNTQALFDEYGNHKTTLQEWVQSEPRITSEFDGVLSKETIPDGLKSNFNIRTAELNLILETICGTLKTDTPKAEKVAQSYMDAARAVFGDKFPKMKIDSVEAENANP